jgi:predicted O-methyltransferase YrrM
VDLDAANALIRDRPPLHDFRGDGKLEIGGMEPAMGRRFITELGALEEPAIIETGAGISTLLFCCLAPGRVTSVSPNTHGLWERILAEAKKREIDTSPLRALRDRSDLALPSLALSGESVDAAFIDGDHGWPSVFVDFCYMNMMLREDGLLFLDDVQLHSVRQLVLMLRHQPGFHLKGTAGKMAIVRKTTSDRFLPAAREQPFIQLNSLTYFGERWVKP